jgi:hypothetical protein
MVGALAVDERESECTGQGMKSLHNQLATTHSYHARETLAVPFQTSAGFSMREDEAHWCTVYLRHDYPQSGDEGGRNERH